MYGTFYMNVESVFGMNIFEITIHNCAVVVSPYHEFRAKRNELLQNKYKVFLIPNVWVSSTRCSYAMIWKGLEMKSWCQIFESHKMQSKWFFCQIATLWTIYREIWKVNKSVSETSLLHSNSKLCYFVAPRQFFL